MLIFLLPIAFLSIFSFTASLNNLLWRQRLIITIVIFSLTLTAICEILSLFHLLNAPSVAISWALVTIVPFLWNIKRKQKPNLHFFPDFSPTKTAWKKSVAVKISIITIFIISFVAFFLALTSAPNNIDAASFGLARVMQWIQSQSLAYYPTHITWQLYRAPWASFANLHTILLSGSDYFTNLIQWSYALGTLLTLTLITRYFKGSLKTQILSASIAAAIPIGITQASATADDYILAFFISAFVYFSLAYFKNQRKIFQITAAISLGLALLTKQVAYLYTLPLLFWFLAALLFKSGIKKTLTAALVTASIVILINFGFFHRNYTFSKSPLFSLRNDYINQPVGLQSLFSGTVKNIAVHLSTPVFQINQGVYQAISRTHKLLGIPLDTPRYNWLGREFEIPQTSANENKSPNTIHLIILVLAVIFIFKGKDQTLKLYLLSSIAPFILFSAIIRYQAVDSRFHLPLFILWSVPIAIFLGKLKPIITNSIFILLFATSLYFLSTNVNKPLLSPEPYFKTTRESQYFILKPQLYEPYLQIAQIIGRNHYKNVGLYLEELNWDTEYPLWVLIQKQAPNIKIQHVSVQNPTKTLPQNFTPDVVVFIKQDKELIKMYIDQGVPVLGLSN